MATIHVIYLKQLRAVLTGIFILGAIGTIYVARDFLLPVTSAYSPLSHRPA
jgi:hypothetical protein